jgi:hypothetical protein
LAKYDLGSHSWKMYPASLLTEMGYDEYVGT